MKTLYILIFAQFILLINSCKKDDLSPGPEDLLSIHFSSKHFDYYYSESDNDRVDTTWQEAYYKWLTDTMNLNITDKLEYYKYRDAEHIKRMTGKKTNGFCEPGTNKFHSVWKVDNHEMVHAVVIKYIGHPPALFNEGIAVAHQANYYKFPYFIPGWNNQNFDLLTKDFRLNGNLPTLDKLLGRNTFWDYSSEITYPVSGSFVRYLIDNYGIDKMKEFISSSKFDFSKAQIHTVFLNVYDSSIESLWNDWELFIASHK